MNLTVKNYRGIKSTDIEITDLTLLAGLNYQGKSSIAQAAASLLTGEILPDDIKKNQCGLIINDSARTSIIKLTGECGSATIGFPECESRADGIAPVASHVGAGLIKPSDMSLKERAKYFSDLLGLLPDLEALKKALPDLADNYIDALWQQITINGWDVTHEQAKKKGAELKGEWKHATVGETYGKLKAGSWEPEGYSDQPLDGIETQLQELKKRYESGIGTQAINDDERKRLETLVLGTQDVRFNHEKAGDKSIKLFDARNLLYKQTPPVLLTKDSEQPCPHCKNMLTIKDGKIVNSSGIKPAEIKKSHDAHDKYYKDIDKAEKTYEKSRLASDETLRELTECEAAPKRLMEPVGESVDLETINDQMSVLIIQRDAIRQYHEARSIHEKILSNEDIVKVLAPDGLRRKSLAKGMSGFQEKINALMFASDYENVEINDDMSITYNKRPNSICSKSERFRRDVMIQLICAKIDGSQVVIIDGADILDNAGLYGLTKAIKYIGIPAIVCMTVRKREDMVDMSAIGGRSYWIEGGVIK